MIGHRIRGVLHHGNARRHPPFGGGLPERRERKAEQLAESEKRQSVAGGVTFQRSAGIDQTYDDLLNWIKREG